jgi:branched-subunit amino acid transport protein
MRKLADIFGYDSKLLPWYRDLALSTLSGIGLLYAFLSFAQGSPTSWDIKFGLASLGVAILCILLSPNRLWVLIGSLSVIMAFGGLGLVARPLDTRSLEVLGVIVACGLVVVFLARYADSKKGFRPPSYLGEFLVRRGRKK